MTFYSRGTLRFCPSELSGSVKIHLCFVLESFNAQSGALLACKLFVNSWVIYKICAKWSLIKP